MANLYECKKAGGLGVASISVTTQPTTTSYAQYDTLNLTGMVITATFKDGVTANVTNFAEITPANGSTLNTSGSQTITIKYGGKTTTTTVSVEEMTAISVTTMPTTTTFKTTDPIDYTGIVVTGTAGALTRNVTSGCTFSPTEGTYFDSVGTKTVTVTYHGLSTTFNVTCQNWDNVTMANNTWEQIKEHIVAGTLPSSFIGQSKSFTLTTGETLDAVLVNIGSNSTSVDSNYYPLGTADFITQNCLNDKYVMNSNTSNYTNTGGWKNQPLRTTLNDTIYNKLPSDLRSVIINKTHTYDCGSYSYSGGYNRWNSSLQSVSDKLWLPTRWEMLGSKNRNEAEDETINKKYSVFTSNSARKKRAGSDYEMWWLSTPVVYTSTTYYDVTTALCTVNSNGEGYNDIVSRERGVPLCFRIG